MPAPVPCIPETAPFTPEQRAWLNGFLAALFSRVPAADARPALTGASAPPLTLTILFGSQTGTAEALARRAAKAAAQRGFRAHAAEMAQFSVAKLAGEQNVLLLTSTFGEGEPPDNAKALHGALKRASENGGGLSPPHEASLANVRYSVCALGDTNYSHFCQSGRDFDHYFEKLGATRVAPRMECDLDYEEGFTAWLETSLAALAASARSAPAPGATLPAVPLPPAPTPVASAEPIYSRKKPFPAHVLVIRRLNGAGSAKEVHHLEFSLEGSGMAYQPGDALGVLPQNCPRLVTDVLAALGCDGEEEVPAPDGSPCALRRALTEHYDLGRPSAKLLGLLPVVAEPARGAPAAPPLHVIDVLLAAEGPAGQCRIAPVDFIHGLRKLQPRLYSISSSPAAHPGRVHLTVGAVRYEAGGRSRHGVCSTFLADRAAVAGQIGVFVHTNNNFRLPADDNAAVIMVGPGTGIAPFRAFLHERRARGAQGRNWLFFGDQHAATDHLYGRELQTIQRDGYLHRLDLAWSRDEAEKVYVQHRMLEHAKEIWARLEEGAHLYVCGDGARMAKDVDAALQKIVETAGCKSAEQAALYVTGLRSARKYQRDVY